VSRNIPIPYFPNPPQTYDRAYHAEVVRAFSVYAQQMNTPGPWRATSVTITDSRSNVAYGTLSWSATEETLDLTMGNDITQQIGFETYMRCENNTGTTIANGTVVGFAGVNGEIKVNKYIADGTVPSLYFIGVTTSDIPDDEVRPVTVYGKVRGLDTTGTLVGETWSVGDILYASPSTAGAFTNVRPTAPNEVIVVAAVLYVDATNGQILVRPTIPISLDYGSFTDTTDQTLAAANTAYAVTLDTTEISRGVTVASGSQITVSQAGFYSVEASFQVTSSTSSSATAYFWLAKNGTDVDDTTRAFTIKANGDTKVVTVTYQISLAASDYIELMWAADTNNILLDAISGLSFAPDAPSVIAHVSQLQL
jgi:hypothetical protein